MIQALQERAICQKFGRNLLEADFLSEQNKLMKDNLLLLVRLEELKRLYFRYKVSNMSLIFPESSENFHSFLQYCLENQKLSNEEKTMIDWKIYKKGLLEEEKEIFVLILNHLLVKIKTNKKVL
jgi:hypothetical protein